MKKVVKFSKSCEDILKIKKEFYNNNNSYLKYALKINNIYKKQPVRNYCKNWGKKNITSFIKNFGVEYKLCLNCNHLNGKYQDTEIFSNKLYNANYSKDFSKFYLNDYDLRVKNIYIPKVEFLKKVINEKIKLMDLGCGGGHFVKALEMKKISATGYDTSKILCKLGSKKIKKNQIFHTKFNDIYHIIKKSKDVNTLSMIQVLEHLVQPNLILNSFKKSKIKYLYISVPLFSLSTFIENSFKNIFPRQLSGGHTHLYTEKSLNFLAKKYNLKIIGEHWFGTDISDLLRSLMNSGNVLNKKIYLEQLNHNFSRFIDELQSVLDKNKVCSEVHIVFERM